MHRQPANTIINGAENWKKQINVSNAQNTSFLFHVMHSCQEITYK